MATEGAAAPGVWGQPPTVRSEFDDDAAHIFPAGDRRAPGRTIPPRVEQRTIGAEDEPL